MPFDIESQKDDIKAMNEGRWFDFEGGARIKITYVNSPESVKKTAEISKRFGGAAEAQKPDVLEKIIAAVVCEVLVVDWSGFNKGDTVMNCTPENVRYVMENSREFNQFVNMKSGELRAYRVQQKEADAKN